MSERRKFTDTFGIGDEVAIIREEHGWHDGRVSGIIDTISDYSCTVRVDQGSWVIPYPRDIRLVSKGRHKKAPKKR